MEKNEKDRLKEGIDCSKRATGKEQMSQIPKFQSHKMLEKGKRDKISSNSSRETF